MGIPRFSVDSVLARKYRVERVLGEGGMGVVVAARHLELGELVALKLIGEDVSRHPILLERFRREARAMMRINSDHVARTHDIGRLEDGTPYMAMEYLEGQDLARRLAQNGPFELSQAVDFMLQACDALAHAHALGIVHRDLKPSNMVVVRRRDGRECLKVIDFGIAKQVDSLAKSNFSLTQTAQVVGSPRYMAPEQMSSAKDVDARADIWSLGVTLFELLTGQAPFLGNTLVSLYRDITTSKPPSILRYRPELPEAIAATIERCLQHDRAIRFGNVAELGASLYPFASERCAILPEQLASVLGPASGGAHNVSSSARADEWSATPSTGPGSTHRGYGATVLAPRRRIVVWTASGLVGATALAGAALGGHLWPSQRRQAVMVLEGASAPLASSASGNATALATVHAVTVSPVVAATVPPGPSAKVGATVASVKRPLAKAPSAPTGTVRHAAQDPVKHDTSAADATEIRGAAPPPATPLPTEIRGRILETLDAD